MPGSNPQRAIHITKTPVSRAYGCAQTMQILACPDDNAMTTSEIQNLFLNEKPDLAMQLR